MRLVLPLIIVASCLFCQALSGNDPTFREFQAALLSVQWMLIACLVMWGGTFTFLTFSRSDWPLIGLLVSAVAIYFFGYVTSSRVADAAVFFSGVTLGKGARFALGVDGRRKMEDGENNSEIGNRKPAIVKFLIGLVVLLLFAAWWHLESTGAYHGPRWMGLWDNPNTYGMLMGAGLLLAIGLLIQNLKAEKEDGERNDSSSPRCSPRLAMRERGFATIKLAISLVAAGMLSVGLVMSYSRGAWLGTAIGLTYLAWAYGKLKWRYVLPVVAIGVAAVFYHWGSTPDSAPWYVKRADLGRPSAQNRVIAWQAGLKIMRDHPLGVGWNNAVKIYAEKYSPPEGGPGAITTNDYLMLGAELGIPALVCFVAYVGLCYRKSPKLHRPLPVSPSGCLSKAPSSGLRPPAHSLESEGTIKRGEGGNASPIACHSPLQDSEALRAACLAGALVFVVAFWFDGGLFKLSTAALFWVLLELGAYRTQKIESEHLANS